MSSAASQLFHQVSPPCATPYAKISIVGVGRVGMACAFAILNQGIASELVMIDIPAQENVLKGEMMDLQHGMSFIKQCAIRADSDYKASANSKLCIITAGAQQREGESRLDLVQRNTKILKSIVPHLVHYSPNSVLLIVSNPVDILTYVTWKLSGFPVERVIGSGTNLDSARFRFEISQQLNIASVSCHGWIIGEHGDSSVAVWSGVNIAGVTMKDMKVTDETREMLHKKVIDSAYDIIKLKGYTCWAIGLSVSSLARNVLLNSRGVCALSTNVKGLHGITNDVFLSLPCILGEDGISKIVNQKLNAYEMEKFTKSADHLYQIQQSIEL